MTDELFMLWAMLFDHPVNTCYYLLDHLSSIGKKRADERGEIVVGVSSRFSGVKSLIGFEPFDH